MNCTTLQRTDTAEGKGIAQGLIQHESQCMGRKKYNNTFGAVPTQPRQQNTRSFLGIQTNVVRPSLNAPASTSMLCKHASICSCHSIVDKSLKSLSVSRSTSGSRRTLELHL